MACTSALLNVGKLAFFLHIELTLRTNSLRMKAYGDRFYQKDYVTRPDIAVSLRSVCAKEFN